MNPKTGNGECEMKAIAIATAGALLVGVPLVAQNRDQGHAHGDATHENSMMEHCGQMMGGVQPAILLEHRDELGLTADQVRQLEAINEQATGSAHMQGAMAMKLQAAELLQGDEPDLAAYEQALREAMEHMIHAHVEMAATASEARAVLTAEQREHLAHIGHGQAAPCSHHDHGSRGHDHGQERMHGHQHGGSGNGAAGCPMMGGAGGSTDADSGHH